MALDDCADLEANLSVPHVCWTVISVIPDERGATYILFVGNVMKNA